MPTFERPRAQLYYEDSGGDGPVVCFSHGILMDADMFASQVEVLRAEFRCIAWDERGHGRSVSDGSFTYWDLADDLLALLDHLDVERALFVGMSQGGYLSLRAALRAPERVAGLFLIDTQAGLEPEDLVPGYQMLADEWATNGPPAESCGGGRRDHRRPRAAGAVDREMAERVRPLPGRTDEMFDFARGRDGSTSRDRDTRPRRARRRGPGHPDRARRRTVPRPRQLRGPGGYRRRRTRLQPQPPRRGEQTPARFLPPPHPLTSCS